MPKRTTRVPDSRFAVLLRAFPAEQLRADFARCNLSITAAAAAADVHPDAPSGWLTGRRAPLWKQLTHFLEANGIDQGPYAKYLVLVSPNVTVVCPLCQKRRTLEQGRLKHAGTRAAGRRELRQLPDGSYERPCARCSHGTNGVKSLKKWMAREIDARLDSERRPGRPNAVVTRDLAAAGDTRAQARIRAAELALPLLPPRTDAVEQSFREGARRPHSPEHRHAVSVGRVRVRRLSKGFHLCPLCWLVSYETPWHRVCQLTWRSSAKWSRWHPRQYPEPPQRSGPVPDLNKGYEWLIDRRMNGEPRRALLPRGKQKHGVSMAVTRFIDRLPGTWNLVFSDTRQKFSNEGRQTYIPLPMELQRAINNGKRDDLIQRLHHVGMAEAEIAQLTGARPSRVQGVVARAEQGKA